jgi:hypothetical protein
VLVGVDVRVTVVVGVVVGVAVGVEVGAPKQMGGETTPRLNATHMLWVPSEIPM